MLERKIDMVTLFKDFMLRLHVLKQNIVKEHAVKEVCQCALFTSFIFSCIAVFIPVFATFISVLGFMLGIEN